MKEEVNVLFSLKAVVFYVISGYEGANGTFDLRKHRADRALMEIWSTHLCFLFSQT